MHAVTNNSLWHCLRLKFKREMEKVLKSLAVTRGRMNILRTFGASVASGASGASGISGISGTARIIKGVKSEGCKL